MCCTAVQLFCYSEARTLVETCDSMSVKITCLLGCDAMWVGRQGKCIKGICCQSRCYSHWNWKVAYSEATGRSPVDGGCDGTWGVPFSVPSERLLGRVSVRAEMQSKWWPAAEVAYTYHTLHMQIKLGRWQKESVHNHQLFHIYLPNNFVMSQPM